MCFLVDVGLIDGIIFLLLVQVTLNSDWLSFYVLPLFLFLRILVGLFSFPKFNLHPVPQRGVDVDSLLK